MPIDPTQPTLPQPYDGTPLDCVIWSGVSDEDWRGFWYGRMEPIETEDT